MKTNNKEKLLDYIANKQDWVGAKELSSYFSVSTRQIRNYIISINESYGSTLIQSSKQGYQINLIAYQDYKLHFRDISSPKTRQDYIIRELITNKKGYSIYDLADDLFVSESTIENDLKNVKVLIENFNIYLLRNANLVKLEGKEINMRKLMNHLISSNLCNHFIFQDNNTFFSMENDFITIRNYYKDILDSIHISTNDFALNNTAIHLMIILNRLKSGYHLDENVDLSDIKETPQFQIALLLKQHFKEFYDISLNHAELFNIFLIIENHTNHTEIANYDNLNSENIYKFVEKKYIEITHYLIHEVEKNYYLLPFHEEFVAKLTLHIKNLFFRVRNEYYAKNPLTDKIKASYPLIYDISVFIAQKLKDEYQITLNEDEIAFISFHIGAYFENNSVHQNHINCAFIYSDYYDYHRTVLDKIMKKYDNKIVIRYQSNITNFNPIQLSGIDLIISTVETPFTGTCIYIPLFMKDQDWNSLDMTISDMLYKKKKRILSSYILNFFNRCFFYKNTIFKNKFDCLRSMTNDVLEKGYVDEEYFKGVCAREKLSSTAFANVAIPHALTSEGTHRTFISIALYDEPIDWDHRSVYIVALIGISDDSRKIFSEFFDEIISIFDNPTNVKQLTKSTTFDEFINVLNQLLD